MYDSFSSDDGRDGKYAKESAAVAAGQIVPSEYAEFIFKPGILNEGWINFWSHR